jgi:CRP-like cAMP-binding protein
VDCGIPEAIADDFLERHTATSYRKGSVIFPQGSSGDTLFWVSGGVVDIVARVNETRTVKWLIGPGDIFGHLSFPDSRGRYVQAFAAQARTDCQIGLITQERLAEALQMLDAASSVRLLQRIVGIWAATTHYWVRLSGMNHRQRLESVLGDLATRFGIKESRGTLLIPELRHRDLAEMIGCTRPLMSRLLAELRAAGRIEQRGGRFLLTGGLQSQIFRHA